MKNQTYPCKHYVFVDGEQFTEQAKQILDKYPEVISTYLPMNTGANGWTNSSINAIAPFLVKEEVICYLDDDNWYEPNHIETGIQTLNQSGADYAFALRNLYDINGDFICEDLFESIGHYDANIPSSYSFNLKLGDKIYPLTANQNKTAHIDTNCYFIKRKTLLSISYTWYSGKQNDTNFYTTLQQLNIKGECTKCFTINYVMEMGKQMSDILTLIPKLEPNVSQQTLLEIFCSIFKLKSKNVLENNNGNYPWNNEENID